VQALGGKLMLGAAAVAQKHVYCVGERGLKLVKFAGACGCDSLGPCRPRSACRNPQTPRSRMAEGAGNWHEETNIRNMRVHAL
jgi:hypothetical protein